MASSELELKRARLVQAGKQRDRLEAAVAELGDGPVEPSILSKILTCSCG